MAKKEKEMTLGEACRTILKGLSDAVFDIMSPKNFTLDDGVVEKPKRARTQKGRYKSDDKSTPDINEAYVGGKAPKELLGLTKKKKNVKRKTNKRTTKRTRKNN